MKIQRLMTGAAIAITLLLGVWLSKHLLPPPIKVAPLTHGTDYTARNITLTQFRASGQLRYRLRAAHLSHTLPDRQTRLTDPVLVVYPEQGTPVTMSSPNAILMPGDTVVRMPDQVVITRIDEQGQRIRALSSNVTVNTRQQTASSPSPSQIEGPGYVTHGVGLDVNFRKQLFSLLKDVQSVYTRPSPRS